jgi:hypothetical protein
MLRVIVSFDRSADRADQKVILHNYTKLTPRAAIAARDIAAGVAANARVSDGQVAYHVVKSRARKV